MRDLLRTRGVYLPIGNNIRVATVRFNLLKEIKPWPTNERSELQYAHPYHPDIQQNNSPINQQTNNPQNKKIIQNPQSNANTPHPKQQTETATSKINQAQSQITHGSTMSLQGMFKSCTSDNDKYNGEPTDNFSRKYALFIERAKQNDPSETAIIKVFSIILTKHNKSVFNHACQTRIKILPRPFKRQKNMSLDNLKSGIQSIFETAERIRALIRQWDNLTLPSIITQHPNKTKTECLTLSALSDIKISLPVDYQSDIIMRNKMLNSIKVVDACKLACQKPVDSIQGVISDIHFPS